MFFKTVTTVGAFTLVSRLTGFLRDGLIAAFLGVSPLADAFFIAFKFPNFFRRFFAEGAFSSAFIPVFSEILTKHPVDVAQKYISRVFIFLAVFLFFFVVLFEFFMPQIVSLTAPGFAQTPDRLQLAVMFTRISFPYIFFISLTALFSGILNAQGKFSAAAAAPILLNLTLIFCLLFLEPLFFKRGHSLVYGVLGAGFLQFLWIYWACIRSGFRIQLFSQAETLSLKPLFCLLGPAALGAGVVQINLFVDVIFASLLPSGAVSYLFYADRLNQLPLGIVGIAISTALLPQLSQQLALKNAKKADYLQNRSLELALILILPATFGLIILAFPLVSVLFQRGAFQGEAVRETARVLMAFAMGLPAYVMIKIFSTRFFAQKDTRSPFIVSVCCVLLNIFLNFFLKNSLAHVGIALSTAGAAWAHCLALAYLLWRAGNLRMDASLLSCLKRALISNAFMICFLQMMLMKIEPFFHGHTAARWGALLFLSMGGLMVYVGSGLVVRLFHLDNFKILSLKK